MPLRSDGLAGLVFCLGLGVCYALWLFPVGFISGSHAYWNAQNEDITVYLSGFNAFFHEPWQWPLGKIASLNWPEGTLTTFVDILPLYATLLKILAPRTWFPFNPFGYWVLLCLILQAVGSWWVLREAQIRGWCCLIALTLLLLMFPAWLVRVGHISLLSQWLIVFAYALTLRSTRLARFAGPGWCVLLICAFFLNVYLFAMVCVIFAADALRGLLQHGWRPIVLWALATVVLLAILCLASLWPIPGDTGAPDVGFGIYSMNLLSPLSGSRWFGLPSSSPEQAFEGFNYLGLGGLLALSAALFSGFRYGPSPALRSFYPLWLLLIGVTLYALSDKAFVGAELLYEWHVPNWALPITGQFRVSGRFFWLVGYAIVIFSAIQVCQRLPRPWASLVLGAAVVLQMTDLWPKLEYLRELPTKPGAQIIDFAAWDAHTLGYKQRLYFFPKFRCGRKTDLFVTLLPIMRLVSERELTLNTGYIARHNPTCNHEAEEIAQSDPGKSVYIFASGEYDAATLHAFFPSHWLIVCRSQDFAMICSEAAQ